MYQAAVTTQAVRLLVYEDVRCVSRTDFIPQPVQLGSDLDCFESHWDLRRVHRRCIRHHSWPNAQMLFYVIAVQILICMPAVDPGGVPAACVHWAALSPEGRHCGTQHRDVITGVRRLFGVLGSPVSPESPCVSIFLLTSICTYCVWAGGADQPKSIELNNV